MEEDNCSTKMVIANMLVICQCSQWEIAKKGTKVDKYKEKYKSRSNTVKSDRKSLAKPHDVTPSSTLVSSSAGYPHWKCNLKWEKCEIFCRRSSFNWFKLSRFAAFGQPSGQNIQIDWIANPAAGWSDLKGADATAMKKVTMCASASAK